LNGIAPDLFMVCELKSLTASDCIFNNATLHNPNFRKAQFKSGEPLDTSLLQTVYYNNEKLALVNTNVIPTRVRDINHSTFTIATTKISLEVFVPYLKVSRGLDNHSKRLSSIEVL